MDKEVLEEFEEPELDFNRFTKWIFRNRDYVYILIIIILVSVITIYRINIEELLEIVNNSNPLQRIRP